MPAVIRNNLGHTHARTHAHRACMHAVHGARHTSQESPESPSQPGAVQVQCRLTAAAREVADVQALEVGQHAPLAWQGAHCALRLQAARQQAVQRQQLRHHLSAPPPCQRGRVGGAGGRWSGSFAAAPVRLVAPGNNFALLIRPLLGAAHPTTYPLPTRPPANSTRCVADMLPLLHHNCIICPTERSTDRLC